MFVHHWRRTVRKLGARPSFLNPAQTPQAILRLPPEVPEPSRAIA
jgi:hypothetical protein